MGGPEQKNLRDVEEEVFVSLVTVILCDSDETKKIM